MTKDVTQGKSYCLTVKSVPCTITCIGENDVEYILLTASEEGQYLFIAPTWRVDISQEDASLVETFNLASSGKLGGSSSGSTVGLLKIAFVDELPPVNEAKENTLYFVPNPTPEASNNYNEYIFNPDRNEFELVGNASIDTSNLAKLDSENTFLAVNSFTEPVTFEKGIKLSSNGPTITSTDSTVNLPNLTTGKINSTGLSISGPSTFTNTVTVKDPTEAKHAANKEYVDNAVDSVPVYDPSEAQTISGAYNFTDGVTRTTKANPANTDIMNKEMSDALYVPKEGNSEIGGNKTFTNGITLADEAQLQLGAGTNAVKIHGMGTGRAVVEGTNSSELDIAIPVDLQETTHFERLEKTIPDGTVDPVPFLNVASSEGNTGFTWEVDGSVSFGDLDPTNASWTVDSAGKFYVHKPLQVEGEATFNKPVAFNKTVTATDITATGTINANGGIHVPDEVTTAQESLSWNSFAEQKARFEWNNLKHTSPLSRPTWILDLVSLQNREGFATIHSSNVNLISPAEALDALLDTLYHFYPDSSKSPSDVVIGGVSTPPWKFASVISDTSYLRYATAISWAVVNNRRNSIMIGSTAQGYATEPNLASPCYAHPIHWTDANLNNYRYPGPNSINNGSRDGIRSFQFTYYGSIYLGSTKSQLIRGTDFGTEQGSEQYIWGLIPTSTLRDASFSVVTLPRQAEDSNRVTCRFALFASNLTTPWTYVMTMKSGPAQTQAGITEKIKTYNVTSAYYTGPAKYGMRLDDGLLPNSVKAIDLMQSLAMEGAVIKPIPTVTPSTTEVPAAGGEVTLTVSSTLSEAIYVLNDTMNGLGAYPVWCTQSAEELPVGTTEVTLTLAANTTGEAREVWAFVGHHYAQAAVVKINQLA